MIRRSLLYALHKQHHPRGYLLSRHELHSANILSRVSRELDRHPIPYRVDPKWAYHLIAYINGRQLSIFANGFDNLIDIMPLKKDGRPWHSKYEVRFLTPRGAVNYILRKWGKPRQGNY